MARAVPLPLPRGGGRPLLQAGGDPPGQPYAGGGAAPVRGDGFPARIFPPHPAGGIESLFDDVVTVADAGKNKSFPDIFLHSAQRLGVPPASCAVFEDNGKALAAARRAGMRTCAVYDGQPQPVWEAICADADVVLYDLRRCAPFTEEG